MMQTIDGLSRIAGRYRVLLVDACGTLHDGRRALPLAAAAMIRARQQGATVVVVTNSPHRTQGMVQRLRNVGYPEEGYDHIACSGELAWADILRRNAAAPPGLHVVRAGTGVTWPDALPNPPAAPAEAGLVLATGMPQATEAEAEAGPLPVLLSGWAARQVPLLVADSDYVYPDAGRLRLGPGWIARRYGDRGGPVVEYGKPFAPIYDLALALAGGAAPDEVLMIGDNLDTDIKGAARRGYHALLVLHGGVHDGLSAEGIAALGDAGGAVPTYLARQLCW